MKNRVASVELYIQFFPESNKFGITPYLITGTFLIIIAFVSINKPGIKNIPLNDIKLSLP